MFEILSPAVRLGGLIVLLIVGSAITQPGFGENLGHAVGSHMGVIVAAVILLIAWPAIKLAVRFFLEGFFGGLGLRESGVFRDLGPRIPRAHGGGFGGCR